MRRFSLAAFTALLLLGLLSPVPSSPAGSAEGDGGIAYPVPRIKAGVGVVDMTWNVGVSAGQYSDERTSVDLQHGEQDPHLHSTKKVPSYGVQSRLSTRALVVEGNNGERVALVKTDNYLPQDLYTRRVGQLLTEAGSSIKYEDVVLAATHNHSSPYHMSPSAGVFLFQDLMDLRMFEYQARKITESILLAEKNLRPARMGGTTVPFDIMKDNIMGVSTADDGTPAGYPRDYNDDTVIVLRFDDMTNPASPKPLATWMNFGEHPESLEGYNLISADFLGALERHVDRETGAPVVFSQGDVGSAEGPYDRGSPQQLPDGEWRMYAHQGYAQMERGARRLADAVLAGWRELGAGGGQVPFSSDFPVMVYDRWTPGPVSHPYPSLSNCRTETTVEANPGVPTGSDCSRPRGGTDDNAAQTWETIKSTGIPVPEHYDHPAHLLLEENNRLRLQAVRLGDVILASCSCEAQVDLILNLKSRLDNVPGNIYDGFDYVDAGLCTQNADTTWRCINSTKSIPNDRIVRMRAQVHNDAKGWDDPAYAPYANSEPADVTKIKGNFTKEELSPDLGYKLAVGIGMAGDYHGYTVSYREYMGKNHYRKSLTSYGPHTADYINTRLVRMAGSLKGGPAVADEPTHAIGVADEARAVAFSTIVGQAAFAAYEGYRATLPNDKGPGVIVAQPAPVLERFGAANFSWQGGSNAIDNPVVRVERLVNGQWQPYADQTGEIQSFLDLPTGAAGIAATRAGEQAWKWTAHFEAYDAFPKNTIAGGQVPNGTYRFVAEGSAVTGGAVAPYKVESTPFQVVPWDGIVAKDLRREPNGDVSFVVDPIAYPRTYTATGPAARFIADDKRPRVCQTCSFRPWASTGSVATAAVTVTRGLATEKVPATFDAATGRWVAPASLYNGAIAVVARGDVADEFGEINGAATGVVVGNETLPVVDMPGTGGGDGSGDGAVLTPGDRVRKARPLPFRGAASVMAGLGALAALFVIAALLAGVGGAGVGRGARRG